MGIVKEFKDFIMRGNVIDLAVGVIIGAAFGAVVKSLVDNIVMPPLGYVIGGIDFSSMETVIAPAIREGSIHPITQLKVEKDIPAVTLKYGLFINSILTLVIQGFAVFLMVKAINLLHKKEKAKPAAPPEDVVLLMEIRDLLKTK